MFQEEDVVRVVKPTSSNYGKNGVVSRVNTKFYSQTSYLIRFSDPAGEFYRTYYDFDLEFVAAGDELVKDETVEKSEIAAGTTQDGFDALDSFYKSIQTPEQEETEAQPSDSDEKEFNVGVEIDIPTEPLDKIVEAINLLSKVFIDFGVGLTEVAKKLKEIAPAVDNSDNI